MIASILHITISGAHTWLVDPFTWFSPLPPSPLFLITIYDKNIESCVETFPRKWMAKAYSLTWLLATSSFGIDGWPVLHGRVRFVV